MLAAGGEVDVGWLVSIAALVFNNVGEIEDKEGEARETAHVDFNGSEPSGSADGVVIGVLDVRKMDVPMGLLFAAHHGEHWSMMWFTRLTPPLVQG